MPPPVQPVRGTRDIIGEDAARHYHIASTARRISALYGFSEWQTPIFEDTKVFSRTLGETSDVVTKEMYTFDDRGGDSITLRPEGTAGVCRALISNGLTQTLPQKIFYSGPMFRYERPQKGRYRQFHQVGIELLGSSTPLADAEVIACGWRLLQELGVSKDVVLNVNTLGDAESRARYRSALVNYFLNHESDLSEESKNRLEKNPLRILDSKDEGDRELCMKAPLIYDHLTDDAEDHYNNLRRYLANFEVPYKQNPRIVRGLDYYNHTAFEFVTTALGSQGTVLAGGRYDGLVEQMGGPSVPGVGWGAGIDRLALLLGQEDFSQPSVVIVPHDDTPESTVISILNRLRENNIIAEYAYTRSSKRHLEKAVKSKTRIVLVFSPETLERNEIMLQDLECIRLKYAPTERTQFRIFVSQNDLIPKLHKLIESFTEDNSLIPFSKRVTPTLSIADL